MLFQSLTQFFRIGDREGASLADADVGRRRAIDGGLARRRVAFGQGGVGGDDGEPSDEKIEVGAEKKLPARPSTRLISTMDCSRRWAGAP